MSVYGLDLRQALWGKRPMGARRIWALIKGIPRDSALYRAAGDDWSQEDELLATIVDFIGVSNHLFLQANVKQGTVLPELGRFPRPQEKMAAPSRTQSPDDDVRAFFTSEEYGTRLWDAHGAEEE